MSIREEEVETCSPAPINWNQPVITDVGSGVMISGFVCVSFLESGLEFNEVIRLCIIRKCNGDSFRSYGFYPNLSLYSLLMPIWDDK